MVRLREKNDISNALNYENKIRKEFNHSLRKKDPKHNEQIIIINYILVAFHKVRLRQFCLRGDGSKLIVIFVFHVKNINFMM